MNRLIPTCSPYKLLSEKKIFALFILIIFFKNGFAVTKTWTGFANDGLWSSPANWSDNTVPLATDDVLLDNSNLTGSYTVILPNTAVTIKTVTITPLSVNTIQLILPSSNTIENAFTISGPGYGLTINSGGIFKNSSGVSSGTPVNIADSIKINNGGKYIQNAQGTHASNVAVLSKAAGTEKGIFEFDVPATGSYSISFSNRTYGTLVLSSAAAGGNRSGNPCVLYI